MPANNHTAEINQFEPSQTATLTLPPTKARPSSSGQRPQFSISAEGREWMFGCGQCSFGFIDPPKWDTRFPLYQAQTIAFQAGLLTFCECRAGEAALQSIQGIAAREKATQEQIEQAQRDATARKANRLFTDAGVPPKFLQYTWESFKRVAGGEKGKELLISAIEMYFADGCIQAADGTSRWGIFAWGESDLGKTGALSQLFLHYLHQGCSGLWVQYNSLLRELRNFGDGNVDERINQCKLVEYLFIDDFGDPLTSGEVSNYSRDVMMQIIDHRNSYGKAMFITSNLSLDALAGQYHQRIAKRMMESCYVVNVTGKPLGVLGKSKR